MSSEYGTELVSVLAEIRIPIDRDQATNFVGPGFRIGSILRPLFARPGPTIVYFPPGRYILDAATQRHYTTLPHVQLFFAVNALLRIEDGVTLELQGSLRAGTHQIFGYSPRLLENATQPNTDFNTWSLAPNAGKVKITGDRIPFVRPEWWGSVSLNGASPPEQGTNYRSADYSEGLQTAIDVACTGRAGLTPLPVLLEGMYQSCRTLEVHAPREESTGRYRPVCLILRGNTGMGTEGAGAPTIIRTRNNQVETRRSEVLVERRRVLLRIYPGVDFDFDGVNLSVDEDTTRPAGTRILTCVEVLCDARERSGRRGLMRRVTLRGTARYQLRITEEGDSPRCRRQFVFDGCSLAGNDSFFGDSDLLVEAGDGVMMHLSDCNARTPFVGAAITSLAPDATLLLKGGSVLVEATLFHRASGPRPSNKTPRSFVNGLGHAPDLVWPLWVRSHPSVQRAA